MHRGIMDVEDGATGQEERRNTAEKVRRCREGGHGDTWCSRREGKGSGEKEAANVATHKSSTQKRKKEEDNMVIDCILDRQRISSFRTNLKNL